MGTTNHLRFQNNIFEPETIVVEDSEFRLLRARFSNLYDLYEYLKSSPDINDDVFSELMSVENGFDFAGKPYDQAVEDLIEEIDPGYQEFLRLQSELNVRKGTIHKYKLVRTVIGGRLHIPSYAAGSPYCYESEELVKKPKFIRVHITLSYNCRTTKSQVLNRAIIITNIVKALERDGYSVDLNAFEMASCHSEISYIIVQLKKYGGRLDMQALYKSLCKVEFLRRVLFRVLETLDVRNSWNHGYGIPSRETFVRKALRLDKDDIFFDQPDEMGIYGNDLAQDFESAINHLKLGDKIDVEKAKREFAQDSKRLSMNKINAHKKEQF